MIRAVAVIQNSLGLHARTAVTIANAVSDFDSEVYLSKGNQTASAKSILSLMMLEAGPGTELLLQAEGADEREAMTVMLTLFANNFGED